MEVEKFLKNFAREKCSCGREHFFTPKHVLTEGGAINKLPLFIAEFGAKKPFILADKNTFNVAGEKVLSVLEKSGIAYSKYVYSSGEIEPDEASAGSAIMHFDNSCDLVIAVGSGVINDIGKILANVTSLPYFIVGTAPSMDGYASFTSSMSMDGLKVSLPSKCPEVIIGDIDVLKNAPMKMLQAGLGDMLAKYVSLAEWKIANEILGEYYCERVALLVKTALNRCVSNADGLLNRDEEAVKSVFEGLVIGGVAMAFAGVSRPASGVEHYFSHVWDMRGLAFGSKVDLHGIQCAIATNIATGLYEKILKVVPNKEKALDYAKRFSFKEWSEVLRTFIGKGAEAMIALEGKKGKYDVEKHAKRLDIILEKWDIICDIIKQNIPKQEEIEKILVSIGAPKTPEEIGVDCDLLTTLKATKDIRDKYVLSRLLWDLGVIEEIL